MEARLLRRPAASCCFRLLSTPSSATALTTTTTTGRLFSPASVSLQNTTPGAARHKSTANRTKRALSVAPHTSFISESAGEQANRIIFNPPSSAPSVFNTPFKFLPKSDPRRALNPAALFAKSKTIKYNNTSSDASADAADPSELPVIGKYVGKQHHLTLEDVEEMRRLRREDPVTNTVHALADKFKCSRNFVMMSTTAPREHTERHFNRLDAVKARWGPGRAAAREERKRRLDMLFRGEL
ncbi:mitochondrial ribosomal protein subunit L20-domain-containing protein [Bombardia bombarda]|uniref:Mitochondrial ribosomal protein subunit L20-domain-containing protein n=1 Tax=Bombardia bombarda TaxID=252184 RepID=A0AA39XKN9_9PEZI|nr:mitochondrial ribosomal protein subunit L20-domain-containing protein [Bombardia bombarda]